jgi:hypothetical protein
MISASVVLNVKTLEFLVSRGLRVHVPESHGGYCVLIGRCTSNLLQGARGGIMSDSLLNDFGWFDAGAIDSAAEQVLAGNHPMTVSEVDQEKRFELDLPASSSDSRASAAGCSARSISVSLGRNCPVHVISGGPDRL